MGDNIVKGFLCTLSLLLLTPAWAATTSTTQAWSIIRYSHEIHSYKVAAQLQNRYSFTSEHMFEEQVNLSAAHSFNNYDLNFIFTLGSVDGYSRLSEIRYALELERDFKLTPKWVYNLRFRQEVRDFKDVDNLAYRFRIRNQWSRLLSWYNLSEVYLNNEINIYLNNYQPGAEGFSSLRTILGGVMTMSSYEWGLAYLNDYRVAPGAIETRHVLVLSVEF